MLILTLLTGCFVLDERVDSPIDPNDANPIQVEVSEGSTARSISGMLIEQGLIKDDKAWRYYLKRDSAGACLKAGRFELNRTMNMPAIMETLCGTPLADEVPFTVLEGWRIREIDAALAEKGWIKPGEYAAVAENPNRVQLPFTVDAPLSTLEGFLLPETYSVPRTDFSPTDFVQRQLETFDERFGSTADVGSRGLYAVVIVASMLEREEPKPSKRPLVAGIMWKRLDNGWQLGIDATSRYTIENWNDRSAFLKQLRDPDDPYNTRLRKGLPPTPIGNPSVASLEAATQPEKSEFWYYLHDSKGVLHPSRNAQEHEALRKKYSVY